MKKQFNLLSLLCILAIKSTLAAQNNPPLIQALNDGNLKFAKELLKKGADVKAISEFGSTALTQAVIKKDKELIKFLLDHGADLFAPNSMGNIPWIIALENNDEDFIEFLRTYKPKAKETHLLGSKIQN